ncbi:MAG: hypothetical protein WC110_11255 [Bacteroidales bacterium]|jgi:hypothetical protein
MNELPSVYEIKEYANLLAEEMLANKEEKIRSSGFNSGFVAGIFITMAIVGGIFITMAIVGGILLISILG